MTDQQHANNFMFLAAKKISSVRYMTNAEAEGMGWYKRPLVINFTDGSFLVPQMDDEGNDGGAMFYQDKAQDSIIYTL
jgi:hypothetical protein